MTKKPDKEAALASLRGFQRKTVAHVVERLLDKNGSQRFLVADEVGLGKTLVARGVIAEFVERHWGSVGRLDIVYLCSNSALARENLKKLRVGGKDGGKEIPATRLTLLPMIMDQLDSPLNFISLTPDTAMRTNGMGLCDERVVLFHLLKGTQQSGKWLSNLLQGQVGSKRWDPLAKQVMELDKDLADSFLAELKKAPKLQARLDAMAEPFARIDSVAAGELSGEAYRLVGDLRNLLARVCIDALQPDLIILDEFQRFKDLLVTSETEMSPAAELANQLFTYRTPENNKVALLLLSATPYRMYTTSAETATDDHYQDFLETVRFLLDDTGRFSDLEGTLQDYRAQLLRAASCDPGGIRAVRDRLQGQLLRVMCRQERVGSTSERDAMVSEPSGAALLASSDVSQYLALEALREQLDSRDLTDLWKSAPYFLNFAKTYEFNRAFEDKYRAPALREVFKCHESVHLTEEQLENYSPIDPGNARLRLLTHEVIENDRWRMLWLPPSLPYWPLRGPWASNGHFTKKLLFSAWNAVPDAVSALLSYEVERRMVTHCAGQKEIPYKEVYRRRTEPLRFTVGDGTPTGMTTLALQLPCLRLAAIHPLEFAGETDTRGLARARIAPLLESLKPYAQTEKSADDSWYWAALLLLDEDREAVRGFLDQLAKGDESGPNIPDESAESATDDEAAIHRRGRRGIRLHVQRALKMLDDTIQLGAFPDDLLDVLVDFTLGSPAIIWARTLRCFGVDDGNRRRLGAQLADAMRGLFNEPPVAQMLHDVRVLPYWRTTLAYAFEGNLQAVLDEYAHQLAEPEAWSGDDANAIGQRVTDKAAAAISTRTSIVRPRYYKSKPRSIEIIRDGTAIRTHFARRYGTLRSSSEATDISDDAVREAFKSPFYPFVLASTSVGQEGLDFHPWCHAVWHWNLPGNPVDLEQREGRVHRYKGHAVRKNVADEFGRAFLAHWHSDQDPWKVLFDHAERCRPQGESELKPFWLADGPHKVERHVPILPLSREIEQLEQLKRSLAIYRVVFGQPRQEELLKLLDKGSLSNEEIDSWMVRLEVREATE